MDEYTQSVFSRFSSKQQNEDEWGESRRFRKNLCDFSHFSFEFETDLWKIIARVKCDVYIPVGYGICFRDLPVEVPIALSCTPEPGRTGTGFSHCIPWISGKVKTTYRVGVQSDEACRVDNISVRIWEVPFHGNCLAGVGAINRPILPGE